MKKGILYTTLLIVIVLFSNGKLLARQSAIAVMEVRVEVISAASVIAQVEDISSQLQQPDEEGECELEIARYELTIPDGANYLMSTEKSVKVKGTRGEMLVELTVDERREAEGESVILLNGTVNIRGVSYGLYVGNQITTIEYD